MASEKLRLIGAAAALAGAVTLPAACSSGSPDRGVATPGTSSSVAPTLSGGSEGPFPSASTGNPEGPYDEYSGSLPGLKASGIPPSFRFEGPASVEIPLPTGGGYCEGQLFGIAPWSDGGRKQKSFPLYYYITLGGSKGEVSANPKTHEISVPGRSPTKQYSVYNDNLQQAVELVTEGNGVYYYECPATIPPKSSSGSTNIV